MGGPAAHIAMMEDEVVRRRRWMTHERFLDMLGVCNLIPGPNSTEMAIHIGQLRAGFAGLVVAGACFILPAAAIVMAIAWMYVRYGTMPQAVGLLYGIKPVIIAVVLQALWGLGRTAIKSRLLAAIAIVSFVAALFDVNDMIVLIGGGVVMMAIRAVEDRDAARATLAALPTVVPRASGGEARRDRRCRRGSAVQSHHVVFVFSESRRRAVRQRLRIAGVPAHGPGG